MVVVVVVAWLDEEEMYKCAPLQIILVFGQYNAHQMLWPQLIGQYLHTFDTSMTEQG